MKFRSMSHSGRHGPEQPDDGAEAHYAHIRYTPPLLDGWERKKNDCPASLVAVPARPAGEERDLLRDMLSSASDEARDLEQQIQALGEQLLVSRVNKAVAEKKVERVAELISELDAVKRATQVAITAEAPSQAPGRDASSAAGISYRKLPRARIVAIMLFLLGFLALAILRWPAHSALTGWKWLPF